MIQKSITRALLFILRSNLPQLSVITSIGGVVALIFFPYKTFFNIKNKN